MMDGVTRRGGVHGGGLDGRQVRRAAGRAGGVPGSGDARGWSTRVGGWVRRGLGLGGVTWEGLGEVLETRLVLAATPLPDLSALERATNPVVRLEVVAGTLRGDIDIELFEDVAPITTANFLNYTLSGRFDTTFFHRVTTNATAGLAVLQGGGFVYDDASGVAELTTDAPIVRENTGRGMLERTLSMARPGGAAGLNQATSQFFINLTDNPAIDTPGNNQFFAFGRVIQGWTFVQQLGSFPATNLTTNPGMAGPLAGTFTDTPTTPQFTPGTRVTEAGLVRLVNAELIKPSGATGFFAFTAVYPDGQRTVSTVETLDLFNPNSEPVQVQVIARYETGFRENVALSLTVPANTTVRRVLSDFQDPSITTLRANAPYSLVVQTSVPPGVAGARGVSASITRVDFNAQTSESFFDPGSASGSALQTWDIARIERNDLSREFVVWNNLGDLDADVTVTFIGSDGSTASVVRTTEAFRRGGLSVADLGLTDGVYAARVTSTQPLVVAVSDFDLPQLGVAARDAYTPGWAALGVADGGVTAGALGSVVLTEGVTDLVSLSNGGTALATVTLNFWPTLRDPSSPPITRSEVVLPGGRLDVALDPVLLGIPPGLRVSVTFESSAPVAAQFTRFSNAGRNTAGAVGDGGSAMFQSRTAGEVLFSGVTIDPTRDAPTQSQVLGLFNPFRNADLSLGVAFRFSDGTIIGPLAALLLPNERADVELAGIESVRAKASSDPAFRTFAVIVTGTASTGGGPVASAGVATLTRFDAAQPRSMAMNPFFSGPGTLLSDGVFGT